MNRRTSVRTVAAGLVTCLLLAPAAVASGAADPRTGTPGPEENEETADLVVTSVDPVELRPDAPVTVTGRVEGGPTGLAGARIEVRRAAGRNTSVSSLERWTAPVAGTEADGADETQADGAVEDPADSARTEQELDLGDVEPSASVPFSVLLDAEELGLRPNGSAAGPYGLQLLLLSGDQVVDDERGFLVWSPPLQVSPTLLSTSVSLLGPPPEPGTGLPDVDQLVEEVSPGGRLQRQLDVAVALDADWLLDPTLLAGAAAAAGRGPAVPDVTTGEPSEEGESTSGEGTSGEPSSGAASGGPSAAEADETDGTDPGTGTDLPTGAASEGPTTIADATVETTAAPTPGTAPAEDSGPTEGSEPTPAEAEVVGRWLDALAEGRGNREVVLRDWADPDPGRIRSAADEDDAWAILQSAQDAALPQPLVEALLDGRSRDDVLVATEGRVTARDLGTLVRGRTSLLLSEDTVPLQDPFALSYTPDDVTEVTVGGPAQEDGAGAAGDVATAVLADPGLGVDVVQALEGAPLATTRVMARLATTTLQRPSDSRLLALVVPAGTAPGAGTGDRLAGALAASQWVQPVSLSTALGTPPSDAPRAAPAQGSPTATLPGVQQLLDAVADGRRVGAALGRPVDQGASDLLALRAAATLSRRADPSAPADLASALAAETAMSIDGVRVVPGSRITLAAAQAGLPVTVVNDLDTEVRLVLRVRSRSPRLQVQQAELPVTVSPGQRAVVDVPVTAVASGRADVTSQLATEDGREWGDPATVTVTVATQVEGRVLGVVGGVVGVLFLLGAVRAFVRNRRGRELEETGQVQQ